VVAIITQAIWNLGRTILKGPWSVVVALGVLALYLLGFNVLVLLFGGALLYGLIRLARGQQAGTPKVLRLLLPTGLAMAGGVLASVPFSQWLLFLTFLKIGAVIYGSGYVLLAFLRADLVQNLHWLTDRQLLDAVSIGQVTPGPVFTTATFIGYVLGGWPGACVATLGIFLPSFVFVPLVHHWAGRLRQSPVTALLLDGANIAALALMAGVVAQLAQHSLTDLLTWGLALGSLALLLRFKVNSVWMILLGAVAGVARFGVLAYHH
jgi:chromate transporter